MPRSLPRALSTSDHTLQADWKLRWLDLANSPKTNEHWQKAIYPPLDTRGRQIRLLKLLPSSDLRNDPEGELYTAYLEEAVFAAISYAWGSPHDQQSMILNGRRVRIRNSAHAALRYLRHCEEPRHVWMSEICINQLDSDEKSQQVPLMKFIYSLATPVLVWTGTGTKSAFVGIQIVVDMAIQMYTSYPKDQVPDESPLRKQSVWNAMQLVSDEDWQHLLAFFNCGIWTRVWILQEILLSSVYRREAILVAGKRELDYEFFIYGVRAITVAWMMCDQGTNYTRLADSTTGRRHIDGSLKYAPLPLMTQVALKTRKVRDAYDCWMTRSSFPDELYLSLVHDLHATNPKDFVYGLSGLLEHLVTSVDYRKPIAEIYEEATFVILTKSRSLTLILSMSHHWRRLTDDVPSWTVDWREKIDDNYSERWAELCSVYNACNGREGHFRREGHHLGVQSHTLFQIESEECLGPATEFDFQKVKAPLRQRAFVSHVLGATDTATATNLVTRFDREFARLLLLDLHISFEYRGLRRLDGPQDIFNNALTAVAFDIICSRLTVEGHSKENYNRVYRQLSHRLRNTRVAVSPTKQMCILPAKTEVGDVVCILAGSAVPFVLRPVHTQSSLSLYRIVGGAYVQGVMDGEAIIKSAEKVSRDGPVDRDNVFEELWLA